MNQTKINKYSRSVSIVGVSCTPFMNTLDNPETAGLTEGEMFGYAALKAMEDAGVEPKDVDYYFHGQANPLNGSNYITPNVQVANWFGMKGKGSMHHSEACCTGYLALEIAANAVASGKYDCVLTGAVEFGDAVPSPSESVEDPKHPFKRDKMTMEKFLKTTAWIYDKTYARPLMAPMELIYDDCAEDYVRTRGITPEQMDDTLNHMAINNRHNAVHNPLAITHEEFEDIAKEKGFDNVMDYMRSPYNPKSGDFLRMEGIERKCDGAAACIVIATEKIPELCKNLRHKPIEIIGIGSAACEASTPHFEINATKEAIRQVYELTGKSGDDLDIFFANDFIITSHLYAAEIAGYLPYGEGWKYICDGRTAFDGDKPINTNGGRTSFGHAHAASGLADVYECCMQMRGECGEHQVKKLPKTAMLRGYGGSQNVAAIMLETVDDFEPSKEPAKESNLKLEKVVQTYYEGLEQGKLLGRKCKRCGAVEFPPVYACNTCGCDYTEWIELSGKAVMKSIVLPAPLSSKPEYKERMGKYAYGVIETEEGAEFNGVVVGISKKTRPELLDKLPLPVHAKIIDRDGGFKTVVYELDEQ